MAEFEQAAKTRRQTGMVSEFWYFLKHSKKWWLLPIVVIAAGLRRAGAPVGHGRRAVHLHALLARPERHSSYDIVVDAIFAPAFFWQEVVNRTESLFHDRDDIGPVCGA